MKSNQIMPKRSSITTQVLFVALGLYLIVTVGITAAHIFWEYRYQKQNVFENLEAIKSVFKEGLAVSLWDLDPETLEASVVGMLKMPAIVGVAVYNSDSQPVAVGGMIEEKGRTVEVDLQVNLSGLTAQEMGVHNQTAKDNNSFKIEFPIVYPLKGDNMNVGRAILYSNNSVIYRGMKIQGSMLIISVFIILIGFSLVLVWAMNKYLHKPLTVLTHAAANLSLDNLGEFSVDLKANQRNELKILEETMNAMASDLHKALLKHREIENDLRESEQSFRTLVGNIPGVTYHCTWNEDWIIRFISDTVEELTGYNSRDFVDNKVISLGKLIIPEDVKQAREAVTKAIAEHKLFSIEYRIHRADGELVWCFDQGQGVFDAKGNLLSLDGVIVDITNRKHAESELAKHRNNLEDLVEQRTKDLAESNKHLEELNEQLKQQQQCLLQSEKMASVGQLAAGVAHEINNPVGFVMSNIGTLQEYIEALRKILNLYEEEDHAIDVKDVPKLRKLRQEIRSLRKEEDLDYVLEDLDDILSESKNGCERIRDIVANLKSFARVDDMQLKESDINEGIEAALKIAWNELKYKCTIKKDLNPLPLINCYLGQLNQVFMNLLINAAHAIEEMGEVAIHTEATEKDIIIEISDTGSGISPEHLENIFDPFFTTKKVGEGTGLGLSISHGIIQKHNGTIDVQSVEGKGTTFTIHLPINRAPENE